MEDLLLADLFLVRDKAFNDLIGKEIKRSCGLTFLCSTESIERKNKEERAVEFERKWQKIRKLCQPVAFV